jgi:hypothetical protein
MLITSPPRKRLLFLSIIAVIISACFLNASPMILGWAPAFKQGEKESTTIQSPKIQSPAFFVYEDAVFYPNLCRNQSSKYPRAYYIDVMDFWLQQLLVHPRRVDDPEEAKIIFIPFNADDSFAAGSCNGKSHYDRIQSVIDFLLQSPIFTRKFGRDHIWPIGHWRLHFRNGTGIFNASMPSIISNMTISSFIDWNLNLGYPHYGIDIRFQEGKQRLQNIWRIMQYWRCTVTAPIFTLPSAWASEVSFESWKMRKIMIHYRGKGKNCSSYPSWKDPNDVRHAVDRLRDTIPDSLFEHDRHDSEQEFGEELKDSKFCLSLRCDDPLASRFYDSLAAGCIPVVISEGWLLAVAPFAQQINYMSFSIHIPESLYWYDPVAAMRFVYNHQEQHLQQMYENLITARKVLLWQHPESVTVDYALRSVESKCMGSNDLYVPQVIGTDQSELPKLINGYF